MAPSRAARPRSPVAQTPPSKITDPAASWADDPRGGDVAWLQIGMTVEGREPFDESDPVDALCDVAAVA